MRLSAFVLTIVETFSIVEAANLEGDLTLKIPLPFTCILPSCSLIARTTASFIPPLFLSHCHLILNHRGCHASNTVLISHGLSHFSCPPGGAGFTFYGLLVWPFVFLSVARRYPHVSTHKENNSITGRPFCTVCSLPWTSSIEEKWAFDTIQNRILSPRQTVWDDWTARAFHSYSLASCRSDPFTSVPHTVAWSLGGSWCAPAGR